MGLGFLPTEYVDVTSTIETKVAMLEAHESQLTWLRDHDGIDIVEQMRTVDALPRPPMRRPVRRGLHPVPDLAPRHDAPPPSLGRKDSTWQSTSASSTASPDSSTSATTPNATACAAIPRDGAHATTRTRTSGSPSLDDARGVLPLVRRRPRRPDSRCARRGPNVRRDPPGRADAPVRARRADDQRGAHRARATCTRSTWTSTRTRTA